MSHHTFAPHWARHFCPHNPFYLISAMLALFGIHVAFAGEAGLAAASMRMQLLCGYTLLLAVASWLVLRLGKVWEDAADEYVRRLGSLLARAGMR